MSPNNRNRYPGITFPPGTRFTEDGEPILAPDERDALGLPFFSPEEVIAPPPPLEPAQGSLGPPRGPAAASAAGTGDDGDPPDDAPAAGTPFTDLGNAERFAMQHHERLRFCKPLGGWHTFRGSHWERDTTLEAERRAQLTARAFYSVVGGIALELAQAQSPDEHARLEELHAAAVAWAKKSEASPRIAALLSEARAIPPMPIAREAFDAPPTHAMLNCPNGTVDLETKTFRPHRREDFITKVAGVRYDPLATAPRFEAFLAEILPDPEVRAWMQRWAGYAATGLIREHLLPIWYGDGANGKGTLAEVLKAVLGSYALSMPEGFFEEQRHAAHATEIARLRGSRLAIGSETNASSALAEAKIKRLTGGDTLTGRFMREDFFDFDPTAKFVLFTNYKPQIKGSDGGIRRRVVLVPFTVTIPPERRVGGLADTLVREEGPGILRWIVEGAGAWFARGCRLDPPHSIQAATDDYLATEDLVGRFLDEMCTVVAEGRRGGSGVRVQPALLYAVFRDWTVASGETCGTQRAFLELVAHRGFETKKSNGVRWIEGIAPLAQSQESSRYGD